MLIDLPRAFAQLDLKTRVAAIPQEAQSRGVFFAQAVKTLKQQAVIGALRDEPLTQLRFALHRFYPVRDLVRLYAIVGAVLDPDPAEGIRLAFRGTAEHFSITWYGRFFQRFLHPNPMSALHWIERSRDFIANHGRWKVEERGPRHAVLHMSDEYFWIESAQRGGAEGLLLACGVSGEVQAQLDGPFDGRLVMRWD